MGAWFDIVLVLRKDLLSGERQTKVLKRGMIDMAAQLRKARARGDNKPIRPIITWVFDMGLDIYLEDYKPHGFILDCLVVKTNVLKGASSNEG